VNTGRQPTLVKTAFKIAPDTHSAPQATPQGPPKTAATTPNEPKITPICSHNYQGGAPPARIIHPTLNQPAGKDPDFKRLQQEIAEHPRRRGHERPGEHGVDRGDDHRQKQTHDDLLPPGRNDGGELLIRLP